MNIFILTKIHGLLIGWGFIFEFQISYNTILHYTTLHYTILYYTILILVTSSASGRGRQVVKLFIIIIDTIIMSSSSSS